MYTVEQRRAYNNARHKKLRENAIKQLGGKCIKCGSTENLHFDHKVQSTKVNKGQSLFNYSVAFIAAELTKCQLLCNACHIKKSVESGDLSINKARGSAIKTAKLTEAKVCEIKKLLTEHSNLELARLYNVSRRSINNIRLGVCWKHVV